MKKIIPISLIIMVVGGVFFWVGKSEKKEASRKTEGGLTDLPLSLQKTLPLQTNGVVTNEKIIELQTARAEFTEGLVELKKMTKRYNKKAMKGVVTPEDERAYRQVEKKSLIAFAQYKKAYIKTLSEMEN